MQRYDIILVGQGLAGTVLAHELLRRDKRILIIDQPSLSACSRISAGMYNPVVFKRLTPSWMAEELLRVLRPFYHALEQRFGQQLLFPREIVKVFAEKQERELWERKRKEPVGRFLGPVSDEPLPLKIDTSFGHGSVTEAGQLDVQRLLTLSENHFMERGILQKERFDHGVVTFKADAVQYKDLEAQNIIFCEGYRGAENPFFSWVPFNPAKGELLTLEIEGYHLQQVINKTVFIAPLPDGTYRVGSTYRWDNINDECTDDARRELTDGVKKIITYPFTITGHKAGVRPAVDDRRPVIGLHPEHKQLGIFNGMGSKGVMLSPYFAGEFCDHLFEGKPLNREADISRLRLT